MANIGRLSVRAFISQTELPLEGATVVVTQREGTSRKYDLLSVRTTDVDGMIRPIDIETPSTDGSTRQGGGGEAAPYALTNIWVEHPGYVMVELARVQIFPGVETLQNIEMVPLDTGEFSLQNRNVWEIPSHTL